MALDAHQQLNNLLTKAENALIFLPHNPNGDAIGSGWALYFFLQKIGVEPTLALTDENSFVEKFTFLSRPEKIISDTRGLKDFVLLFNTQNNRIINIRNEEKDDELRIYITPEKGAIDPRDFSLMPAKFKYDLIFVLGATDKESLGSLYENNPDIFYEAPLINIDNHALNENFGQINLVDITASSTAEIIFEFFQKIDPRSIDESIATCLLTGIISATDSFQKKNTTPKSLEASASLISMGAKQQEIIRYLYKTQPLSLLKLWGRVMSHLKLEEKIGLIWSEISIDDFVGTRSNPRDIPEILEKLRANYATGKFFLVFYHHSVSEVRGVMKFEDENIAKKIALDYSGVIQNDLLIFSVQNKTVSQIEKELIEKMEK